MTSLDDRLRSGRPVLIDGGTGTELERRGVPMVENAWCAMGALTHPDVLRDIHRSYIDVGAELVITNTFATARHLLEWGGLAEHFEELNRRGVELAREARDAAGREGVVVAASISTSRQGGPLPPVDVARVNYADQATILAEAGADLFVAEMMRDVEHTEAVLAAMRATRLPIWLGYSTVIADDGQVCLHDGGPPLGDALAALDPTGIELVAVMHTEVGDIDASLDALQASWSGPVGVYAHSGVFEPPNWRFNDVISPEDHTTACLRWRDRGVHVLGGCCGIGPEHIAHLAAAL